MILKQLKLHNIRSYEDETINFDKNITLLSGDIGCGKSSILLSIEFALFGFVKGTVNGDMLLRKGTTTAFAELTFKINDDLITIKRTLKKTSRDIQQGNGSITIDGVTQDYTPTELKDKILTILGYPKSLLTKSKDLIFRYTVYTPQELMKQILFEDVEQRLNSLRKVFDIEKYKTIKDNINIANSYFRQQITYLKNITQDHSLVENKIKNLDEQKIRLNKDIEIIKERINKLSNEKTKLLDVKKNFEGKINELNEKNKLIHSNKELIKTKEEQNSEFKLKLEKNNYEIGLLKPKIVTELPEKMDESIIQQNIIELNKKIDNYNSQKSMIQNNIKIYENNFNDLNKRIIELRRHLMRKNEINNNIEQLNEKVKDIDSNKIKLDETNKNKHLTNAKLIQLNKEISNSKSKIEKINELIQCPTCNQNVSDIHKNNIKDQELEKITANTSIINNLKVDLIDLDKQIIELRLKYEQSSHDKNKLVELNLELKDILNREKEYNESFTKLNEIKTKLEEYNTKINEFSEDKSNKWQNELQNYNKRLENARNTNKIINEQQTLKSKIENLMNLKNQYSSIINNNEESINNSKQILMKLQEEIKLIDISKFEELNKNLEELQKQIHDNEIKLNIYITELKNTNNLLVENNEKLKDITNNKNKLKHLEKTKNWMNKDFVELMDLIEKQTMSYINQEFNEYFQQWHNMLMDNDIDARIDENFSVIVNVNGYDYAIESLSGGEKTAIALAYRLALNQVINSIQMKIKTKDLLILDEPTDGFSKEQLDRVRDVIKNANAKQIIIVSHEALLESFADHIIKIEKINNKSKVSY